MKLFILLKQLIIFKNAFQPYDISLNRSKIMLLLEDENKSEFTGFLLSINKILFYSLVKDFINKST